MPDLVFVTGKEDKSAMQARLEVLNNFPNSQHEPILITNGLKIPVTNSSPKSRWNFQNSNWEQCKNYIEVNCNQIPTTQENIKSFT